jgi:peptidoglycan/xylan/chitin deacetylase (PgdA/CDA1 family)
VWRVGHTLRDRAGRLGILDPMSVRTRLVEATPAPIRQAARRARHAGETRLTGSITSVRTDDPVVAFTYDDGPHPERTPAIADALEARGARGTFFVLVDEAEARPDLVRRLVDGGHEVALHGAAHRNLRHCNLAEAHEIIRGGKRRLEAITGRPVKRFRPPFAEQTRRSYAMARAAGLDVVVWSNNTRDCYLGTVDEYVERACKKLKPGAIVLFHDGLAGPDPRVVRPDQEPLADFDRVDLAQRMLDAMAERDLSVVTVGELLTHGPAKRAVWLGP